MIGRIEPFMTWTLSISCLSSVVDYEENLFERFDRNAPQTASVVGNLGRYYQIGNVSTMRQT
jgi:hypothetical protein